MGLALKNPLVVAASPLSMNREGIQKATDAGAAAVVFFSLFEEQVLKDGAVHPYFPGAEDYTVNPDVSGKEVEGQHLEILKAVKSAVNIPVALKLSPFFSSLGHMAHQFDEAGADALVLFNRFYQPDFDLDAMEVEPSFSLSTASDIRLPLRWIAMLHGKLNASLAASTGVQTGKEVIKVLETARRNRG